MFTTAALFTLESSWVYCAAPALDQVDSRNPAVIVMPSSPSPVVVPVSLNDDDDDQNGAPDLKQSPPTAAENNLRELHFGTATSGWVG